MSWLRRESGITTEWLLEAFAKKLQSGRFMFTVARLLDISGVPRSQAVADLQTEFTCGNISVTSVAPITGKFSRVGDVWNADETELSFIVAPRLTQLSRGLLDATLEVFYVEQCEPRSELIRQYLDNIYSLPVTESEIFACAFNSPEYFQVHGGCVYPSLALQRTKRRDCFSQHPSFSVNHGEKQCLHVDDRFASVADFFISHFADQTFSPIQFVVLVKLYGPEVFADAPAGLAVWFYERSAARGVLKNPLPVETTCPVIRVITVVPICVHADPDELPPVVNFQGEPDPSALLKEKLLFVHCFKHELLAGQSVLLNQVNNLCRVRSGLGSQINFRFFGFPKLRNFLEDIPGVKVNGAKHNMAVCIENIHEFAEFIGKARSDLGGDDESLAAGFETIELPQLIPPDVIDKIRAFFRDRPNGQVPTIELLTNFKTHLLPSDPLVYKRLGYKRIKDFIAAVPFIKKRGSKGVALYEWCDD